MNEYLVNKANAERKFAVPANGQAGGNGIAFNPKMRRAMLKRFQNVDELVHHIEAAIAVAA